jgi:hypothetical protein
VGILTKKVDVVVRMSNWEYGWLKRYAERDFRTPANQLRALLREFIKADPDPPDEDVWSRIPPIVQPDEDNQEARGEQQP